MSWLGLDIGGANLKAADGRGWAASVPFELWRQPNELTTALNLLLSRAPSADRLAVTTTGELCDCFRTKDEGVRHILASVHDAARGHDVRVYLVDGRFVSIATACDTPQLTAASNWHALAQFACRYVKGQPGVLIDIGSTTSDIVPLIDGRPYAKGFSDTQRLIFGELVYSGVGRTPVCAITQSIPWRGNICPVAAEHFATTADVYLVLGSTSNHDETMLGADGRPMTKHFAIGRLARMICADETMFNESDAEIASASIRDAQLNQLGGALSNVLGAMPRRPEAFVLSGSGEFLARMLIREVVDSGAAVSLSDELGTEASRAAPAHALAVLAREAAI